MSDALSVRQWRCAICGYVHVGREAPDCCPVCGTGSEDFEPYEAPVPTAVSPAASTRWQCLTCYYIHEGTEPPALCPVCGAAAVGFQAAQDAPQAHAAASDRIVIVGSGIAGVAAAEAVRSASAESEITLVSSERELPYYRLNLTASRRPPRSPNAALLSRCSKATTGSCPASSILPQPRTSNGT